MMPPFIGHRTTYSLLYHVFSVFFLCLIFDLPFASPDIFVTNRQTESDREQVGRHDTDTLLFFIQQVVVDRSIIPNHFRLPEVNFT